MSENKNFMYSIKDIEWKANKELEYFHIAADVAMSDCHACTFMKSILNYLFQIAPIRNMVQIYFIAMRIQNSIVFRNITPNTIKWPEPVEINSSTGKGAIILKTNKNLLQTDQTAGTSHGTQRTSPTNFLEGRSIRPSLEGERSKSSQSRFRGNDTYKSNIYPKWEVTKSERSRSPSPVLRCGSWYSSGGPRRHRNPYYRRHYSSGNDRQSRSRSRSLRRSKETDAAAAPETEEQNMPQVDQASDTSRETHNSASKTTTNLPQVEWVRVENVSPSTCCPYCHHAFKIVADIGDRTMAAPKSLPKKARNSAPSNLLRRPTELN